jgi:hypothetical protein
MDLTFQIEAQSVRLLRGKGGTANDGGSSFTEQAADARELHVLLEVHT